MSLAKMTPEAQAAYEEALRRIEKCRQKEERGIRLDLAEIGLTEVPSAIGQLIYLRELWLDKNQLTSLPQEIYQLAKLRQLTVQDNKLTSLPPEIGQLTNLWRLSLENNRLDTLPPEIGQLTKLWELSLEHNRLTKLPPEIGRLAQLKKLSLQDNQLADLPAEIVQLAQLRELSVQCNQFTSLPPEIGRLGVLEQLNLRDNNLTTLPKEIGQLKFLTWLSLHNNSLVSLPQEMAKLRELDKLYLHGNPGLGMPDEVLGPTWQAVERGLQSAVPRAILDYYFARQTQGEAAIQEVRLLLVGRGRVGKTTLLKALRGDKPDKHEAETPGITVQPLSLKCGQGQATAHVWDFGGQEFLHGTHQIFLSERCVYVLVLEGRESNWETETDYWLRFIQSFGGDSPVVMVLAKYDAHPFSVDKFRLQERCPQIVDFVETDAFTRRGIEELLTRLQQTVNEMEHVWLGVPRKWHQVKEKLTAMPQSYLEYADYQLLCRKEGLEDESQHDSLAQTLHRLGMALNFRDHHRLRHTSVLKPQWVTEAIYGLLRFAQKQDCNGVLERSWLDHVLPRKDYPGEKHAFVLELMEKFEIAFPLETAAKAKEPTHWLIPELLPEVQPEPFAEFRAPGVKRLRFTYPESLPPGLLPRLIVRTHEMSAAHPQRRWRGGVVLEWNGCKALVRLDRQQRQTTVEVIDSFQETQQSLFDIIRAELDVLHDKVRAVEEVELQDHPGTWVSADKLRLLERKGKTETEEETRERDLTTVQVVPTLDGIESREAREAASPNAPARMRLFVSYAHADERKLKPLGTHLKILGRRGYIQVWDDKQLIAGEEWEERIIAELRQADIVVLVYSNAARGSDFIQDKEAPAALKLRTERKCALIVVPLDRQDWDGNVPLENELRKLQAASWNAKPVLEFKPQGKGWAEVEHSIRRAVEARRKARAV